MIQIKISKEFEDFLNTCGHKYILNGIIYLKAPEYVFKKTENELLVLDDYEIPSLIKNDISHDYLRKLIIWNNLK